MINLQQELVNFPGINLNAVIDSNPDIPDNIKNSIVLYNKALDSLRTGNEDIAIIELKKTIAMNRSFHEAMNLLGICYSYINEFDKATEMFEKVVAEENNSVAAMKYLNIINPGSISAFGGQDTKNKTNIKIKKNVKVENTKKQIPVFLNNVKTLNSSLWMGWLRYAVGFVVGALVVFFISFVISPATGSYIDTSNNSVENTKPQVDSAGDSYKVKYDQLDKDFKKLQNELDTANVNIDYYKNTYKLFEVDKLASDRNYEGAADMLVLLKTISFKGAEKARFDSLYKSVMPQAAAGALSQGIKLSDAKHYREALDKLEKARLYGDKLPNVDRILYYTGKCHMGLEDSRNAIAVFQEIIDKYPKSTYVKYARSWINLIKGQP